MMPGMSASVAWRTLTLPALLWLRGFFFMFYSCVAEALAHADVDHFHEHREGHGEVDVTLWYVDVEALHHQHEADHHQEGQGQHLQSRVFVDEGADGACREQHHDDGHHDGNDH